MLTVSAGLILWIACGARSAAAQAKQDFLTANIDSTVSPRDDFFQYANGGWFKRNPNSGGAAQWGPANDDIESQLRRLNEEAARRTAPKGSLEQLIGDFWLTAMDSVTINRQGLAPLKPDLDRINRIRSIGDLIDVAAMLHRRSQFVFGHWSDPIFLGRVGQDERNTDRRVYSLLPGGITMYSSRDYSAADPRSASLRQAFRECLFRTFLRLQRDSGSARSSADAVYGIEARLAASFEDSSRYQMIGLADLNRLAPTIAWKHYLQRIIAGRVDSVDLRSPRFYRTMDSLLRTTPLDSWKDYLRFWLIKASSPCLDDATFGVFADFDRAYTGALGLRPRWQRVLRGERNVWLGQPLARLFEQEYVPPGVKARHQAIAESIREAFGERIERLEWMSDSTKKSAMLKMAHMKITVGIPEKQIDYRTMPLRRDAYVLNVMRANTWLHERDMRMLHQPVDRSAADLRPMFSGGEYDYANNEARLGAATFMLVPGLRDENFDDAVMYGAPFLAHEISHAFDSDGRHYDAYGNKVDWWTAQDDSAFEARSRILVDEYDAFMPLDSLHVNGRASLRENVADLVGLRVALDAFKKTEQFRKNERVAGFTPLQRFFLAYAYGRMVQESNAWLATMLRSGAYAPFRERVNGVLMNIPEFYDAFGVRPGDRMYRPDNARVNLW